MKQPNEGCMPTPQTRSATNDAVISSALISPEQIISSFMKHPNDPLTQDFIRAQMQAQGLAVQLKEKMVLKELATAREERLEEEEKSELAYLLELIKRAEQLKQVYSFTLPKLETLPVNANQAVLKYITSLITTIDAIQTTIQNTQLKINSLATKKANTKQAITANQLVLAQHRNNLAQQIQSILVPVAIPNSNQVRYVPQFEIMLPGTNSKQTLTYREEDTSEIVDIVNHLGRTIQNQNEPLRAKQEGTLLGIQFENLYTKLVSNSNEFSSINNYITQSNYHNGLHGLVEALVLQDTREHRDRIESGVTILHELKQNYKTINKRLNKREQYRNELQQLRNDISNSLTEAVNIYCNMNQGSPISRDLAKTLESYEYQPGTVRGNRR